MSLALWKTASRWFRRERRHRQLSFRPTIDSLEDRCLLATFTVTDGGDTGLATQLRSILGGAANGDTITFAVPTVTLTAAGGGTLAITKSVTLQGPATITESGAGFLMFNVSAGVTSSFNSLTLTGGSGAKGGAISNSGTLTVQNSTLSGNTATQGGAGIYNTNTGTVTVLGSTITGNTSSGVVTIGLSGGGIFSYGSLTIQNSTITNNKSTAANADGGAIAVVNGPLTGTLTLTNSTISGNTSGRRAGGVAAYINALTGSVTIDSSTISGNTCASYGGGILVEGGGPGPDPFTVRNSTIANNMATGGNGGGVSINDNATADTFINDTITGNTSSASGGGIFFTSVGGTRTLTLQNCILAGNTDSTGGNDLVRGGGLNNGTINASNNLIQNLPAGTINGTNTATIGGNPLLGPLQNNGGTVLTEALASNSPALDAGNTSLAFGNFDERGSPFVRTFGGGTDLGAFELQPYTATITLTSSANPSASGQSITFTATLTSNGGVNLPTGSLQFLDGTTTLGSGTISGSTATFTTSTLSVGTHSITAVLAASASFNTATSNAVSQVVTSSPTPPTPPAGSSKFFAVGADAGGAPQVVVYNASTGAVVSSFYAFSPSFTGGVRVAVGDVNGDGTPDIIAGAGPGGGPQVEVIDGTKLTQLQANGQIANSALLNSFFAFNAGFTGGVYVAAGSTSTQNWVAVSAGPGGGPQVAVYTKGALNAAPVGTAPAALVNFFAFAPSFTGGVSVALGDVNGDGKLDVITGAGPGGGPQVTIVDGAQFSQIQSNGTFPASAQLANFFAFNPSFTGGVFVSGGPTAGSQFNLILSAGPGGGPQVEVIDGSKLTQLQANGQIASSAVLSSFFAVSGGFTGGVRVGYNGAYGATGKPAILTAAGPTGGPQVAPFSGATFQSLTNFFALPSGFTGGLFIAG